jgi:uncharacterized membrane protein YesL
MQRLWDILQVNFFWVICSIPIVTIGASTAAAFKVCLHMVDDEEGYIAREFFKGFKENWKQGTVLGLVSLIAVYAVYLDIQLFNAVEDNPMIFLIAAILSGILFTVCLLYAFPLMARYQNTLWKIFRNSFEICRRYAGRTLVLILVLAVELIVWFFNRTTLFIGFFIGPACLIYTIAGMSLRIFQIIEKEPGAVTTMDSREE